MWKVPRKSFTACEAFAALRLSDFFTGLYKTFFFGVIIALSGCYYGLQTKDGTQGVGQATTKAVVTLSFRRRHVSPLPSQR